MSVKKCCVPNCNKSRADNVILHLFPNPDKNLDRFILWMNAIGGDILLLDHHTVFACRRVCHSHFEAKYHTRSNRLSPAAVPTLNLHGVEPQQPLQDISNQANINDPASQSFVPTSPTTSGHSAPSMLEQPVSCKQLSQPIYKQPGTSLQQPGPSSSKGIHPLEDMSNQAIIKNPASQSFVQTTQLTLEEHAPSTFERHAVSCKELTQPIFEHPGKSFQQLSPSTSKGMHLRKHLNSYCAPDIVALRKKINKLQNAKDSAMTRLKKALKLSENTTFQKAMKKFTTAAGIFTMLQFREVGKKITGRRFNKNEKVLALALYKQGPRAYRWLRKIFVLPSPLTLSRMISRASLKPGINKNVFAQLKKKAKKMSLTERLCVLLFDEVSIKPHFDYNRRKDCISGFVNYGECIKEKIADHALVFMVRGIQKNYKQPVAYSFCAGTTPKIELAVQIKEIINNLYNVGFRVIATICDQGATNVSAINYLINNTKIQYMKDNKDYKNKIFEIDGIEIVPLYDPPHLIKGIRNNLLNKNLIATINEKVITAKWEHIIKLYKENEAFQGLRILPKLTENHVVPQKIFKMKVKCATQVFSHSVAVQMSYLAKIGRLPSECEDTAKVLFFFDDLFDSVNGSFENSKKRSGKHLLGAVTPNSRHRQLWKDSKKILGSMKFVNDNNIRSSTVPSLSNWLQTIENIEYIVDILSKKYGLTSIWMRHFNQDPLENFFGCIRSHGYRNISPTCAGFEAAYASLLINNMSSIHSKGSNCEADSCTVFKSLNKLFFCKPEMSNQTSEIDFDDVNIDHIFIDLFQKRSNLKIKAQLDYVTGYVLRKLKVSQCSKCKDSFFNNTEEDSVISLKEYDRNKKCLTYPAMSLIKCFSQMQDIINSIIKKKCYRKNIRQYIKTIFSVVMDYNFINCDLHKKIIIENLENITINIFLYNWCKDTNKILCGNRTDFDQNDRVQVMCFEYCKKRHNK